MKKPSEEKYLTCILFDNAMRKVDLRFDRIERNFDDSMRNIDLRFEHIEKNMATKGDFSKLALAIQKNDSEIQSLKESYSQLATKGDVQIIISTIDAFTKKVTVQENKALTHDHRLNELGPKVENHEKRLVAVS